MSEIDLVCADCKEFSDELNHGPFKATDATGREIHVCQMHKDARQQSDERAAERRLAEGTNGL